MTGRLILTFTCVDRPGIVAAVAGALADVGGFILDSQQHADLATARFFMRVMFTGVTEALSEPVVAAAIAPVAARFDLDWLLVPADRRMRLLVAVSSTSHCLADLLHRWASNALPIEIVGVVSNHDALRDLTDRHAVAFHHLPIVPGREREQEQQLEDVFDRSGADMLVLARYMRVLSPAFVAALGARCVNIHHGFLPSFKGAKPYHQAHDRGVKLIGATAHFVTSELDDGPIIEQAVERVDHRASVDNLIALGRDIEARVLASAVKSLAEHRVLLNGRRTVVFA